MEDWATGTGAALFTLQAYGVHCVHCHCVHCLWYTLCDNFLWMTASCGSTGEITAVFGSKLRCRV